jgi:hypothetical protein
MTPRLADKYADLAKAGDLWTRGVAEDSRKLVRDLSLFNEDTQVPARLQASQDWLLGAKEITEVHVTLQFKASDVLQIGADIQQRITTIFSDGVTSYVLLRIPPNYDLGLQGLEALRTENWLLIDSLAGQYMFFPIGAGGVSNVSINPPDLYLRYLVPIEHGFRPAAIATLTRDMVAGLDFLACDGFLVFNEPPETLFPDGRILVRAGRRSVDSLFSYTLRVDQPSGVQHIANYYRNNQSAAAFQLAIAEACGLIVLPRTSLLNEILTFGNTTRYIFQEGVVDVCYPHPLLQLGVVYPKNLIIGNGVQVASATSSSGQWWQALDWSQGLCLDSLCQTKGLVIPNKNCRVWAASHDTDYHVRIDFQGAPAALNAFWAGVKESELATGIYLNRVIGLTSLSQQVFLNPLNLYFTYLLGPKALVVQLNTPDGPYRQKALDFIHREKPVGSIVIIK